MTGPSQLGERVRCLRGMADLTIEELAHLASLSPGTIAKLETAAGREMFLSTVVSLAHVFGVSLEYLATGSGKEPTPSTVQAAVERAKLARANTAVR